MTVSSESAGKRHGGEASSTRNEAVQVLHRQAQILDCFTRLGPRLRASDIRSATDLPNTTVARILRSMVEENLLLRTGDHYAIGLRVMAWSAAATAGSDLIAAAQPVVTRLRDRIRESCIVYVRQGTTRVAVLIQNADQSIIYQGKVGQILPLNAGAAGKVFMAFDDSAYAATTAEGFRRFTQNTLTDPDLIAAEMKLTRDRGWAFSPEEREHGLSSMAAPLTDTHGRVVGALAIGAPAFRLSLDQADRHAPDLLSSAQEISQQLF